MKKFVTLSAIALAGATLGVGNTFAWWSDGTEDDSEKTKVKLGDKVEQAPGGPEKFLLDDVIKFDVASEIVIEDEPPPKPKAMVHFRKTQTNVNGNRSSVEKLADQLQQEAKELEDQGRKEAAATQRKIADRLREALKDSGARDRLILRGDRLVPINLGLDTDLTVLGRIDGLKEKLAKVKAEAQQSSDKADKEKQELVLQDLKKVLEQQQAEIRKIAEQREVHVRKLKDLHDQKDRFTQLKLDLDHQHGDAHLEHVGRALREAAERLEQEGKQDEAKALRQHAEQVVQSLKRAHTDAHEVHAKQFKLHQEELARAKEQMARMQEHAARVHAQHGGHEVGHPADIADHVRHLHIVAGTAGGEDALRQLHKQLKELRHEIGELRDDVRKLRKELKSDREDEDEDEDEDEADDEKEVRGKDRDDDDHDHAQRRHKDGKLERRHEEDHDDDNADKDEDHEEEHSEKK